MSKLFNIDENIIDVLADGYYIIKSTGKDESRRTVKLDEWQFEEEIVDLFDAVIMHLPDSLELEYLKDLNKENVEDNIKILINKFIKATVNEELKIKMEIKNGMWIVISSTEENLEKFVNSFNDFIEEEIKKQQIKDKNKEDLQNNDYGNSNYKKG